MMIGQLIARTFLSEKEVSSPGRPPDGRLSHAFASAGKICKGRLPGSLYLDESGALASSLPSWADELHTTHGSNSASSPSARRLGNVEFVETENFKTLLIRNSQLTAQDLAEVELFLDSKNKVISADLRQDGWKATGYIEFVYDAGKPVLVRVHESPDSLIGGRSGKTADFQLSDGAGLISLCHKKGVHDEVQRKQAPSDENLNFMELRSEDLKNLDFLEALNSQFPSDSIVKVTKDDGSFFVGYPVFMTHKFRIGKGRFLSIYAYKDKGLSRKEDSHVAYLDDRSSGSLRIEALPKEMEITRDDVRSQEKLNRLLDRLNEAFGLAQVMVDVSCKGKTQRGYLRFSNSLMSAKYGKGFYMRLCEDQECLNAIDRYLMFQDFNDDSSIRIKVV